MFKGRKYCREFAEAGEGLPPMYWQPALSIWKVSLSLATREIPARGQGSSIPYRRKVANECQSKFAILSGFR